MGRSYVSKLAFPGVGIDTEPSSSDVNVVRIASRRYKNYALLLLPEAKTAVPKCVIVFTHGNATSIVQMRPMMQYWCNTLNVAIVAPEIPGKRYDWGRFCVEDGEAPDEASEDGYVEVALAAFDWVSEGGAEEAKKKILQKRERKKGRSSSSSSSRRSHDNNNNNNNNNNNDNDDDNDDDDFFLSQLPLLCWGVSLGSGPACEVSLQRRHTCSGLIVQSGFLSAVRVVLGPSAPTIPLTDIFVNCSKVHQMQCPVLIVHGTQDTVIPVEHGEKLYHLASTSKKKGDAHHHHHSRLVLVEGADHNDVEEIGMDQMCDALLEMMEEAKKTHTSITMKKEDDDDDDNKHDTSKRRKKGSK